MRDLTRGKQGSGLDAVRRRQQSGGVDGGSLCHRSLDQDQSLLRPARQQVRFGGGDVRIHHLLGFSESGQLSASFLEQDQSCCYVARPALRPTHFLAYQGHQVLVTNGAGDPERVLEQWQRLVRPALPYQDLGPVVVSVRSIGGVAEPAKRFGRAREHKQSIRPAAFGRSLQGHVVQHMGLLGEVPKLLEDAQRRLPVLLGLGSARPHLYGVQYRVRLGLRFQLMSRLCFGEASLRPSAGIRVATLLDPADTRSGLATGHERRPPPDLSRR